ncbi:ion transporter [Aliagarivorans taiwanensis]|uniref:ion transporter n=1 Tax=Aliagarivorans taiwanensis TaxID=561966 RepID=UPI0004043B30|nr:ion transporter [Aliagarivorans taiwanensis]
MLATLSNKIEWISTNKLFERCVIAVIILAALLVGAKTFILPHAVSEALSYLDFAITVFFVLEISMRFAATKSLSKFLSSGWNIFDSIVVMVSLLPLENSEIALVARLVRVFRVMRMISVLPELRFLINSLIKALPQLGYVMLLMFIIFYIYAAIGNMLFADISEFLWGDIAISMLTLFRVMTFEDWTDVMYETMEVVPWSWTYYVSFIFLTAFAFLNMVIGIVVGVMDDERNKQRMAQQAKDAEEQKALRDEEMDEMQLLLNEVRALRQELEQLKTN